MKDGEKNRRQVLIANGVVEKNGNFLMVKRQREWDNQSHGKWEIPGGKVDFGEHPKQTVVREVKEETGFEVEKPKLLSKVYSHVWDYGTRKSHVIILPYTCSVVGGKKNASDKNVQQVEWFTRAKIKELDCLPGTYKMLSLV